LLSGLQRVTAALLMSDRYKRITSFVHVSISYERNILPVEIVQGLFGLNLNYVSSVLNVDNTSTLDKLEIVNFKTC
jgi:hypothetical protein